MKELYMRSILCFGLQLSTNLKYYIPEEKFCWMKSIIKFFRWAFGITYSCVRGPNFVWICV